MEERRQRDQLQQLMHLHAANSPLKVWEPDTTGKFKFDTNIQNPFIDKSDLVNHKRRQSRIGMKMDAIQQSYQGHRTLAQHDQFKKQNRDLYYNQKMAEYQHKNHQYLTQQHDTRMMK